MTTIESAPQEYVMISAGIDVLLANTFLLVLSLCVTLILFPFLGKECRSFGRYMKHRWKELQEMPQLVRMRYEAERVHRRRWSPKGEDEAVLEEGEESVNDMQTVDGDDNVEYDQVEEGDGDTSSDGSGSDLENDDGHTIVTAKSVSGHVTPPMKVDGNGSGEEEEKEELQSRQRPSQDDRDQNRMVSQSTQCSEIDFEVLEMRTQLPLRSRSKPFVSVRTRGGNSINTKVYKYNLSSPISPQYADQSIEDTVFSPDDPAHWIPETSALHIRRHVRSRSARKVPYQPAQSIFGRDYSSPMESPFMAKKRDSGNLSDDNGDNIRNQYVNDDKESQSNNVASPTQPLITTTHTPETPEHHPLENDIETQPPAPPVVEDDERKNGDSAYTTPAAERKSYQLPMQSIVAGDDHHVETGSVNPIDILQADETSFHVRVWHTESESMEWNTSINLALQRFLDQLIIDQGQTISLNHTVDIPSNYAKEINLSLAYKWLTRIPMAIMDATHITYLNLSDNFLTTLPNWLFDVLKSLVQLDLSKNFFLTLPDRVGELKKLKKLNLSHNRLEYLPTVPILNLAALQQLNVSHNMLVALPNDLVKLSNSLTDLNFSHNFIVSLPSELKNLKRLKYLKGTDNPLMLVSISTIAKKFHLESRRTRKNRERKLATAASIPSVAATTTTTCIPSVAATTTTTSPTSTPANSDTSPTSTTIKDILDRPDSSELSAPDPSDISTMGNAVEFTGATGNSMVDLDIDARNERDMYESESESDNEESPRVKMTYKKLRRKILKSRSFLLLELLESEKRFIQSMNVLFEMFFLPLKTQMDDLHVEYGVPNISESDMDIILPNEISAIITVHRSLLIHLQSTLQVSEYEPTALEHVCFSDLFRDKLDLLEHVHSSYVPVYETAIDRLHELQRQSSEFDKFLISRRRKPVVGGIGLDMLLALPLHRLRKYNHYLERIKEATVESHADHDGLMSLIPEMQEIWKKQKSKIFMVNNKFRIAELQRKFRSKVLPPSDAVLIREGNVTLAPSKEVQLIKKDIMAYKKKNSNSYVGMVKNITMDDVKKFKLEDLHYFKDFNKNNIWDVRLTEISIGLYLFKDCMVIRERRGLLKMGKITKHDLSDANVELSDDNDREFIVKLRDKNRYFAFVCKTRQEMMSWYDDMAAVICDLQQGITSDSEQDMDIYTQTFEDGEFDFDEFDEEGDEDDEDFYNAESDEDSNDASLGSPKGDTGTVDLHHFIQAQSKVVDVSDDSRPVRSSSTTDPNSNFNSKRHRSSFLITRRPPKTSSSHHTRSMSSDSVLRVDIVDRDKQTNS